MGKRWERLVYRAQNPLTYPRSKNFCQNEFGGKGWEVSGEPAIVPTGTADSERPGSRKGRDSPPSYETVHNWRGNLISLEAREEANDTGRSRWTKEAEVGRKIVEILNKFLDEKCPEIEKGSPIKGRASFGRERLYVPAMLVRFLADPAHVGELSALRGGHASINARAEEEVKQKPKVPEPTLAPARAAGGAPAQTVQRGNIGNKGTITASALGPGQGGGRSSMVDW